MQINEKSETYICKVQDVYKDLVDESLQAQIKIDDLVQQCHDEIAIWKKRQTDCQQERQKVKGKLMN